MTYVTQADRDAAQLIRGSLSKEGAFVFTARHREASVAAAVAERDAKIAGLVEALREMCESAEYWAGCDEGVSTDNTASEIMSSGGAWPAASYRLARAELAKHEGKE